MRRTNEQGTIELAYMFVFIFTSILLTVMTVNTANMIRNENENLVQSELNVVADSVSDAVLEAIEASASGHDVEYIKDVEVPRQVLGMDYVVKVEMGRLKVATSDGRYTEFRDLPKTGMEIRGDSTTSDGFVTVHYVDGRINLE